MSNNIRHLRVVPQILISICQKEPSPRFYAVTKNPLPPDAVVIGVTTEYHADGPVMDLEIESKEFTDDVPDPLPPVEFTQMIAIISIGSFVSGSK